jgi:hypothetical protein
MFQVRKLSFLDACALIADGIASAVIPESAPFSSVRRRIAFLRQVFAFFT